MNTIKKIRDSINEARSEKKLNATLHSLVLVYSEELESMAPDEFCRLVGVRPTYCIEFRKMIAASRRLAELGFEIRKALEE